MPFVPSCCCPRHEEWRHGEITSQQLRSCSREESTWLESVFSNSKSKNRKRKICVSCRYRLQIEIKYQKLEETRVTQCNDHRAALAEDVHVLQADSAYTDELISNDVGCEKQTVGTYTAEDLSMDIDDVMCIPEAAFVNPENITSITEATSMHPKEVTCLPDATSLDAQNVTKCQTSFEKGTQQPIAPTIPYKLQCLCSYNSLQEVCARGMRLEHTDILFLTKTFPRLVNGEIELETDITGNGEYFFDIVDTVVDEELFEDLF